MLYFISNLSLFNTNCMMNWWYRTRYLAYQSKSHFLWCPKQNYRHKELILTPCTLANITFCSHHMLLERQTENNPKVMTPSKSLKSISQHCEKKPLSITHFPPHFEGFSIFHFHWRFLSSDRGDDAHERHTHITARTCNKR